MKKYFLILAAILLAWNTMTLAGNITEEQARKVATTIIYERSNLYGEPLQIHDIAITGVHVEKVNGDPVYYAFNFDNGFAIIAADDRHYPVIGYALEGEFRLADAPVSYRSFMRNYADQVMYIREQNIMATPEISHRWEELLSDDVTGLLANRDGRDVEPLVDNLWNQDNPYNVMCPEDPAGPGGHTYVGCVATAMSMIMYYYRYPETGTGQHCYVPGNMSYGQQCAYYGNTTYQWTGMKNTIDNKNPFPIAEIQYHCAVSVNMNFSPNGSGSHSYLVPGALSQYFRYNNAQYLEKNNYPQSSWISLLKSEIDLGRPLYYSGYNPTDGGHAFVCDGYQGDDFHFNFGWSGYSNGFYSLSNVGGFYNGQGCVRYFYPTESDYPYHNTGAITLTGKSGSFADGSGPVEDYLNNNTASWLIDPQTEEDSVSSITLEFKNFDIHPSDMVRVYDGETSDDPLLGEFTGTTIPSAIVSSGNKLCITLTSDGSGSSAGFYAEYSTTSPVWCSGMTTFTEANGTFDDGSSTFNYQGGSTCMWNIAPEYANKITLYFNNFDTEAGVDIVKVFDGSSLITQFSGNEIPDPVEATSGSMFVTFTTNQFNNYPGWEAYYETDNVGIPESQDMEGLSVFPNPVSGELNISLENNHGGALDIEIISTTGKVIYKESQAGFSGHYNNRIDTHTWARGLYILKIKNNSGTIARKIVVN